MKIQLPVAPSTAENGSSSKYICDRWHEKRALAIDTPDKIDSKMTMMTSGKDLYMDLLVLSVLNT